jgi:hypothetical protein
MPKLYYLCFLKFFCLLVLLLSPLIRACVLNSAKRVELSSFIIILIRLELKSFALILVLLLGLKDLFQAYNFIIEKRVLYYNIVERAANLP